MVGVTFSRGSRMGGVAGLLALALVVATAGDGRAVVLESQAGCQKAVSKAGRKYVLSTLKTRRRCGLRELAGESSACNDGKVTAALGKARDKFDAAVEKGCAPLSDEALSDPRPAGLSLEPMATLLASLRSEQDRLVGSLLDELHAAPSSGTAPSDGALDCQDALDRAAAAYFSSTSKLVGTACHQREDLGRGMTGEVSRVLEACLVAAGDDLAQAASKSLAKLDRDCDDTHVAELGVCPDLAGPRTIASVTSCVLDRARDAAAAAIAAEHGRDQPRVIGRLESVVLGGTGTMAAADAMVVLLDEDGVEVASGQADANGRVELPVPPLSRVTPCRDRGAARACADEPIDVGLETVHFESRLVEFPADTGEVVIAGRLLRSDGSPCFDASISDFALRGGVRVGPTGGAAGSERVAVSSNGDFVVAVPASGASSLFADCGGEETVTDLGSTPDPSTAVEIHTTNVAPTNGAIDVTTALGTPLADPATVAPGDTLTLHASFDDTDALEYRWEVTRGDGELRIAGQPALDPRRASGPDVEWVLGGSSGIHQVTLWASDGRGGVESVVETIGPFQPVGDLAAACLVLPKLQKFLCATGYTAAVPEPAGGRTDFLGYKYRNAARNSAGDACAYYNIVDPDCIDMNCDGIVDPGTDPLGKCKRTTLGGWWQKNGFDPVTGLGTDVISAWYLNSNDLGFGREMHCRVTSWSTIIADRPAGAPTSASKMVEALRDDILASPQVAEYTSLFGLYPSSVACYVTNYTTDHCYNYPTNDPQNADLAYQGQQTFVANPTVNPTHAYGTVAMEFGPVEGFGEVGPITKFFVYNGRTASGQRLTAANLDGCGPKSVPELCMSCHGGAWPGNWSQGATLDSMVAGLGAPGQVLAGIDANDKLPADAGFQLRRGILEKLTREEYGFSSFLPFDPDTYVFPAAAPFASQAASIRKLNQLVLYAKPVTPISDLVKGWYGNNLVSGTFAPWRPSAWNDDAGQPGDESDLYDDVYALACRGCHVAHYSFSSPLNFPMPARVCKNGLGLGGSNPTMPHAKLTYLNLWKGDFPQAPVMSTMEAWFLANDLMFTSCD